MYNSDFSTVDVYNDLTDYIQNEIASGKTTIRAIMPIRYAVRRVLDVVTEAVRDMYYEVVSISINGTYITIEVRNAY